MMKIRIKTEKELERDFGPDWKSSMYKRKEYLGGWPEEKNEILGKEISGAAYIRDAEALKSGKLKSFKLWTEKSKLMGGWTITPQLLTTEQEQMKFGNVNIYTFSKSIYFVNGKTEQYEVECVQYCTNKEFLNDPSNFSKSDFREKFKKQSNKPYPQFYGKRVDNGKLVFFDGNDVGKVFKNREDYNKSVATISARIVNDIKGYEADKIEVDEYSTKAMYDLYIGAAKEEQEKKTYNIHHTWGAPGLSVSGLEMKNPISQQIKLEEQTENIKLKPIRSKSRMVRVNTSL